MNNKKNQIQDEEVHIKQINPRKKLSDIEKTAILQFKLENQTDSIKELSKTKQFKLLNSKKKSKKTTNQEIINDNDLMPKKKVSLTDTIKIKISDLRAAIEEKNIELPALKQKKSLYDTVIIKLDNIINSNNSLKTYRSKKL